MELTAGERQALENLSKKSLGEDVGWINIADARALADKGLALRDRQGWRISPQGATWLAAAPAKPVATTSDAPRLLHPAPPIPPVSNP